MVRINMEVVIEDLDENFARVLKAVVDDVCPGNECDSRAIMRSFRTKLERGFERWERVSDRAVDAGY